MTRPRAADDFATIRARMEELRRERAPAAEKRGSSQLPLTHAGATQVDRSSPRLDPPTGANVRYDRDQQRVR